MKRLLDIVLSSVGLVLLLPVFALVALVLRFTGEGEIWFRQPRIGRGGKIFQIRKFATMLKASPDMPGGVCRRRALGSSRAAACECRGICSTAPGRSYDASTALRHRGRCRRRNSGVPATR